MKEAERYVPGVCNIDAKGRRKRAVGGVIGIAITISLWAYLNFLTSTSLYWQFLLVIPAFMGFTGIWQAKFSFCVKDAAKQQYEIAGTTEKVTNAEDIAKDKKKAIRIHTYSVSSALLLTGFLMVLSGLL